MKVVSIVGARPQYIKLAALHAELLKQKVKHLVINSGQHYDYEMAGVFFDELSLPEPIANLEAGSADAPEMTARIIERVAVVLKDIAPDLVVVYGDTNTTLAGAIAAKQFKLSLAHVEAGLRCFDLSVPEELNRVITDRISDILLCPTPQSVTNLKVEGIRKNVYQTGDLLYDILSLALPTKNESREIAGRFGLAEREYLLVTLHRADAVDNRKQLTQFVKMLSLIEEPIIFPIHPRTRKRLEEFRLLGRLERKKNITLTPPCSYRETLALASCARMVLTDSGGLQREAFYLKVPTLLLREVTEWVELPRSGGSMIVGFSEQRLMKGLRSRQFKFTHRRICRRGAAARIASRLTSFIT